MRWTLPNILTVLRLIAAPGVAIMFLYFARPYADWFAMLLFILAAITDYIDGYLARAWKQETKFGAMMDPIGHHWFFRHEPVDPAARHGDLFPRNLCQWVA